VATVALTVAGHAAPKGSRIVGMRKNGTRFTREASKRAKPWLEKVIYAAGANRPGGKTLEPPYEIELAFFLPKPKKPKYGWPVSGGDLDKLVRGVLDGLTQGELILDDRHVVSISTRKEFVAPAAARVDVVVSTPS
jgi:crossover junction endodeoxyribonuclease RusA